VLCEHTGRVWQGVRTQCFDSSFVSLCVQGYAWFFFGYEATIHYLAGPGKTKADLDYLQVSTCLLYCSVVRSECQ
jgi:hypothetical protein